MRVLLVVSRFPLPPWRGNQLRTLQWLDALAGHDRLLLCPEGDGSRSSTEVGAGIVLLPRGPLAGGAGLVAAVLRGRPAQEGVYDTAAGRRSVVRAVSQWRPDVVVVQMVRCAWAADEVARVEPTLPMLFDAIDCMALHWQRAAATAHLVLRPVYRLEAGRCRRREDELVGRATVTTAVTRRDLEALGSPSSGVVVPVAAGIGATRSHPPEGPPVVLLSGNLGYRPTIRAALWFADHVWTELRRRVPGARWVLAGARPAGPVLRLSARPGVEVHGDVADLASHLGGASVAVAPMTDGSGVPVKVLEAMAMAVPVVAEPWSAAGLEDPSAVAAATGATHWVETLETLLTDREAADYLGRRGHESWRAHYAPERVAERVRAAVAVAAGRG